MSRQLLEEAESCLSFWNGPQWAYLSRHTADVVAQETRISDIAAELERNLPRPGVNPLLDYFFTDIRNALEAWRRDPFFRCPTVPLLADLSGRLSQAIEGRQGLEALGHKFPAEIEGLRSAVREYSKMLEFPQARKAEEARREVLKKFLVNIRDCDILLRDNRHRYIDDTPTVQLIYGVEPEKTPLGKETGGGISTAVLMPIDVEEAENFRRLHSRMRELVAAAEKMPEYLDEIKAAFSADLREAAR